MKAPIRLTSYLSAVAAAAVGQADAATFVTLYGPGARTTSTDPATPSGIGMDWDNTGGGIGYIGDGNVVFGHDGSYLYFSPGTDLTILNKDVIGYYQYSGDLSLYGAQTGDQNYISISFDGDDDVYEAVGQFFFDGAGGGYLVAIAENDDDSALSISAGKAAIDAIPEPTTAGLLALGAAGLATLRRRNKSA